MKSIKIILITILTAIIMFSIFNNMFNQGNSSENLETLIKDGAFLVDVRTPQEFADGNVKGSTNIPLDILESQLDKFKDKKHIVVFCRSGNRSSHAQSILEDNGFTNVTNGGTWQEVNQFVTNK